MNNRGDRGGVSEMGMRRGQETDEEEQDDDNHHLNLEKLSVPRNPPHKAM
jgi:hypothetical protein